MGDESVLVTTHEASPLSILLVEDDDACADFVIDAFAESVERVVVTRVVRLQEALQRLATLAIDVVLLDLTLPDAFDLLGVKAVRAAAPDLALVVLTGSLDGALCARVIAAGADDYLQKDQVDTSLLRRSIWYARDRRACLDGGGVLGASQQPTSLERTSGAAELDGSPSIDALMAAITAVAVPTLAAWCVIQIHDDDARVSHHAHAGDPPSDAASSADLAAVVQSARPSPLGGETLVVPILVRGQPRGTLQLGRSESAPPFGEDHLELAVELARRAALTFESARLYRMARATIEHRDVFRSITSQELRKPLSKLQISIDRMQRTVGRPTSARPQPAVESFLRLARFITTLDTVAAGKLVIELREMDLAELAHEVVRRRSSESSVSVSVGLVVNSDAGATGSWDRLLVEQVMTNLLNHADKYSSGKPVDLSIITGTTVTTLSVRDHGTGIASHDLGRVFDRFELHVARQIVEAHGGSIDVESEPGRGSTVTVRLPRQPAGTHPSADAPS